MKQQTQTQTEVSTRTKVGIGLAAAGMIAAAAAGFGFGSAGTVRSTQTYTVNTSSDKIVCNRYGNSGASCSLRGAVMDAHKRGLKNIDIQLTTDVELTRDASTCSATGNGQECEDIIIPSGQKVAIYSSTGAKIDSSAIARAFSVESNARLSLDNISIVDNGTATSVFSPAISSAGTLSLQDVTIDGSRSSALSISGKATIVDSTFTNNSGAEVINLQESDVYIEGTSISGNNGIGIKNTADTYGGTSSPAELEIIDSQINNNDASGIALSMFDGGDLLESVVTIQKTQINDNADYGISVYADVDLTVDNTEIDGNGKDGISYQRTSGGTAAITNTTVSNNGARGVFLNGRNGTEEVFITNTTISGNAETGVYMSQFEGMPTTIAFSTITNNATAETSTDAAGGIWNQGYADGEYFVDLTLLGTIVADNMSAGGAVDCSGPISSAGYNIVADTTGCTFTDIVGSDVVGQSPLLASLAANGGYGMTHELSAGSPAIDMVPRSDCMAKVTSTTSEQVVADGRGVSRDINCDAGAYEVSEQVVQDHTVTLEAGVSEDTLQNTELRNRIR